MISLRRFRPVSLLLFLAGSFCFWASLHACAAMGVAHADPVGTATVPPFAGIGAELLGYAMLILAAGVSASALIGAVAKLMHAIAARTANTTDDAVAAGFDSVHNKLDEYISWARSVLPGVPATTPVSVTVTNHTVPSDPPATVTTTPSTVGPVAALLTVLLLGAVALQPACGARPNVAAGAAAGLDCESDNLKAIVLDGLALATTALLSTISGSGHPDTAAIKAAFGATKSDALRCLESAAFAALLTPAPAQPGAAAAAAAAAGLTVDPGELRAAFAEVRAGWGVPSVRVAGQVL